MEKTYWNKNICQWSLPHTPQQINKLAWIKYTIGNNEYYGQKLNFRERTKLIMGKIVPLFFISLAAPVLIPPLFFLGTYRKLGIWIREVHYNKTIKYIIKVAAKANCSKSLSLSDPLEVEKPFQIPDELILSLLSMPSLTNSEKARRYLQTLACVSKSIHPFLEATKLSLINRNILSLEKLPGINRDFDKLFSYLNSVKTQLKNLNLIRVRFYAIEIEALLSACPNLTSFRIGGNDISEKGLKEFKNLKFLTTLHISDANEIITDKSVGKILKLKSLTSLHLDLNTELTDIGLKEIGQLTSLTDLSLRHCKKITNQCLQEIGKLSLLLSLNIGYCDRISDLGLEEISKLKSLTSLDLYHCDLISDKGLAKIATLTSLTSLSHCHCYQITDKGVEEIAKLTSLTSLEVSHCQLITDEGLKKIAKLTSLTHLNIAFCNKITNKGLEKVTQLKDLTFFKLIGCDLISNKGLEPIKKLKFLTSLIHDCDETPPLPRKAKRYNKPLIWHPRLKIKPTFNK